MKDYYYLDWAILATLAYSKQFNVALTFSDLFLRLINPSLEIQEKNKKVLDLEITKQLVRKRLKLLVNRGLVKHNGLFFYLTKQNNYSQILDRQRFSKKIIRDNQKIVDEIAKIPYILAIYLTGSVAVNSPNSRYDDFDLLIITKRNKLWLTRLLCLIFLIKEGRKGFWLKNDLSRPCLNYFLDENHLTLPQTKRSLYRAYEIIQSKKLYLKDNCFSLVSQNDWIKRYLLNNKQIVRSKKKKYENIDNKCLLLSLINWLIYILMKSYLFLRGKVPLKQMKLGVAVLHSDDKMQKIIEDRWKSILTQVWDKYEKSEVKKTKKRK